MIKKEADELSSSDCLWAHQLPPCDLALVRRRFCGPGLRGRICCQEQAATGFDHGWAAIKLNPQPIGARLSEICPGLCVACLMAPLQAPKGLLKVSSPLASDNRRAPFTSRGLGNVWLFDTNTGFMSQWVFSPGKWERLMFVPRTADVRATVSALQSLKGSKGMGFQTFSLSLCRRIVVYFYWLRPWADKRLRKSSRRSWRLGICVKGVLQHRS